MANKRNNSVSRHNDFSRGDSGSDAVVSGIRRACAKSVLLTQTLITHYYRTSRQTRARRQSRCYPCPCPCSYLLNRYYRWLPMPLPPSVRQCRLQIGAHRVRALRCRCGLQRPDCGSYSGNSPGHCYRNWSNPASESNMRTGSAKIKSTEDKGYIILLTNHTTARDQARQSPTPASVEAPVLSH